MGRDKIGGGGSGHAIRSRPPDSVHGPSNHDQARWQMRPASNFEGKSGPTQRQFASESFGL